MQRFLCIFLSGALGAAVGFAGEPATAGPAFLEGLVQEALSNHPSILAAQARADAARAATGSVRLWDDPKLSLGARAADEAMRRDDGDLFLGVDQMLPRPRLYEAEKRKAAAAQAAEAATRAATANDLGRSVTQAALELALADALIRIQTEDLALLDTMVQAATERAKNPNANAADTLRLESEEATRRQALDSAHLLRKQLSTNLNLWLGRPSSDHWESLALPHQPPALPSASDLLHQLETHNPTLASRRNEVEGSSAESEAARRRRNPALSMEVGTNLYSGGDVRDGMVTLNVNLPWFNRSAYSADISKAELSQEASRQDLAAEQRRLIAEATALLTEAQNQSRIAHTYGNEILPKSEKALDLMQTAWVGSQATLVEVLDTRRNLLMARQERARALAAGHAAAQGLNALTGGFQAPQVP